MFLESYSSTPVKSSRGKNKKRFCYTDVFVKNAFDVETFNNANRSNFLQNTKLNIAIDIKKNWV